MGFSGMQMRIWTLFACLSWMCVGGTVAKPQYMVAIPAVLEAGAETKFCASLLRPSETLTMTVTLVSQEKKTVLLQRTSSTEFHTCVQFQAPLVQNEEVQNVEVEVQGETFHSKEVRKVMFKIFHPLMFVQTDKPIYLPGQTVHFRVLSLDGMLRPVSQLYSVIEIEDPHNNRIGQWVNETSNSKMLQLSQSLNSEAREGLYKIMVLVGGRTIYDKFEVKKYVLPKFSINADVPSEIFIGQEEFKVEVCAKYTYGQPVPANVVVNVCPQTMPVYGAYHYPVGIPVTTELCDKERKQTNKNGCATFTFKASAFYQPVQNIVTNGLDITVKVEEEGTGTSLSQNKNIRISYKAGTLSFVDVPTVQYEGSKVEGKVKAVHHNNTPIADMVVYVIEGQPWAPSLVLNLTTDSEGLAAFSFNITELKESITFYASSTPVVQLPSHYGSPYYENGYHSLFVVQPSSPDAEPVSFLEVTTKTLTPFPCDTEVDISILYTVEGEDQGSMDVIYLVLSRGTIVKQGHRKVEVKQKTVNRGEVSFKLRVSPEMAPRIRVVAYAVLPSENVPANSADFPVEKCFSHKVSVEFTPSSAVPGEEITMQVTALPDALCGISTVDQSVFIQEAGNTLTADKIFELLSIRKTVHIYHNVQDPPECVRVRTRRYVPAYLRLDASTVFQTVGLKMATNLVITTPVCLKYKGKQYTLNIHGPYGVQMSPMLPHPAGFGAVGFGATPGLGGGYGYGGYGGYGGQLGLGGALPVQTVRTFFPETWIWDLVDVGESGTKKMPLTVPDTITTWETDAFCLSPQGFGLAPRKKLTVFQPFFLELSLPYSIVRGEQFELKATVFNYLTSCIMITVTPAPSLEYTLTPLSGDQYSSCLCGSERKTLSWTMIPSALGAVNVTVTAEAVASHASCDNEIVSVPERGRIDVVTKSLIVKAEGTEITKTYNWLLCPKGDTLTEDTEIQLPGNVIDGSARASVSVLGDILGRALKNLDGLLRMPYGCGEQNMALLAPNIYILQYLNDTQQLTPAIKKKATNFLTSGYQRQLNYKHIDGSYSTFGSGPGNTWLTAFVLRSFAKAQSFVYVDPKNIEQSKMWLEQKQQLNGCFEQSGKLFNNRMKGGVSDEVTLTAYITAAFLEMNMSANHPVVVKGLWCLRQSIPYLRNTYTTALMAYVFTLAGNMETRALLLQYLDTIAVRQGGFLYWSQTATESSASLSVEISSYVLMAKLSASPTAEDVGYTSSIVRWLAGQQNYYGGFSSTQDTVVALQALALYSSLVFSPGGSSAVAVQGPSDQLTFDVNPDNKLLYQEKTLRGVRGNYSVEVKGTACAAVQLSLRYNIPTPVDVTTLRVEARPEATCTSTAQRPKLTLKLKSLYTGKQSSTNMVILDIKMLSGFVPDPESLQSLKSAMLVDRVEQKEDHVLVYFRELQKNVPVIHSLELIPELPVENLKAAVVKIYDYYQPSDQAETDYIYHCAAGNRVYIPTATA